MIKDTLSGPIRLTWTRLLHENISHAAILYRKYPGSADLWHCHEGYFEMVIALSGSAVNETESGRYSVGRGNVFVMPAGSVHHYVAMDHFQHYVFLIKPDFFDRLPGAIHALPGFQALFQNETAPSRLLHIEERFLPDIVAKTEISQAEYMNRSPGWLEAFYGEFFCTLIAILRHAQTFRQESNPAGERIRKTIRHMEKNLQTGHSLQSLSAAAQMSVSNFRLQFRTVTGFSPIDYLIRLRLKQAVMLMLYTDLQISEIMGQTGFSDSSYFTRQFHAVFGKSPREFRNGVKMGIITPAEEIARILCPETGGRIID